MNVAFVCGSLEPGKDGVGDYTRRLAESIVKRGHNVLIIALHDKFVDKVKSEHFGLKIFRIPASYKVKDANVIIHEIIHSFCPDWISLQYVPFSFQKWGLPYSLITLMKKLVQGKKNHIMFHELWVGMDSEANLKHKVWGMGQMWIVKWLVSRLNPNVIHTSNYFYQSKLLSVNIKSDLLELFGNIPVINTKKAKSNKDIILVMFGGIHHGAPANELAKEVASYSKENNVIVSLYLIGRNGAGQRAWIEAWETEKLPFRVFGEQSQEFISNLLSSATAGLSTTPLSLIGKSGTVAAMLEHGLNVLCISRNWKPSGKFSGEKLEGIIEYKKGNFAELLSEELCLQGYGIEAVTDLLLSKMVI
jgi:hypothetical protein